MTDTRRVELKRYEFNGVYYANVELIEDRGAEWTRDKIFDRMCYNLHAYIFGQKLAYQEVKYPANWKEAVKERFAPKWLRTRWPVRYMIHKLEAAALFPDIVLQERPYAVCVFDDTEVV